MKMNQEISEKKRCTAIILAAGSGSRMKSGVAKQFMLLNGRPLLWYSLQAVQQSKIIDDCILVAGSGSLDTADYVRREILEKYGFTKVAAVVAGGSERCWSVENAMALLRDPKEKMPVPNRDGYVFIHDSARPFLTEDIIRRTYEAVQKYHACVAAMPSKDTVKLADTQGFTATTPDRRLVWTIQTPQVFDVALIADAYRQLREQYSPRSSETFSSDGQAAQPPVTDDAGVVERYTDVKVKLVEGSYRNIKITTPEDLKTAEALLNFEG